MHPKIRAVMSKALGDVIKLKMGEEKEKLYKELRETAQSGGGGGTRYIYILAKAFRKVV